MTPIPLEDNYTDILAKALRGLRITREDLASRAGLEPGALAGLLEGHFDEDAVRKVAPLLNLGPESLVALGQQAYHPGVEAPEGLQGFSSPFDDYHVNAYMVWDPTTREAVAFDTGSDSAALVEFARQHGLTVRLILLTHTHLDHIMALDALKQATGAPAFISAVEPTAGAETFEHGHTFRVGNLQIETRRTTGHTKGGTSYVVTGLAVPLVIVGDALFAGSMGGGLVSFEEALATNRQEILSLPEQAVVAPGHGPLTTVGLERRHNPFYPEFTATAR